MLATIRNLVACGLITILGTGMVQASPIAAINYDNSLSGARSDGPYTVGNLFQVGSHNLLLTALGIPDINLSGQIGTGFQSTPLEVGLWTSTGTLIATASVATTDPLTGSYRYDTQLFSDMAHTSPISSVTLTAGTSYLIGALVGGGNQWFGDSGSPTVAPYSGNGIVSLVEAQFNAGGTLSAPLSAGGDAAGRWAPANFLATTVPEPSALVLGGLGLVGLCWGATRRRRQA
jgi:hypothetical protein